jgi:hypothetical protein
MSKIRGQTELTPIPSPSFGNRFFKFPRHRRKALRPAKEGFWNHVGTMRGLWTVEIWVGVLGGIACILASLASRGSSRRSAIYASLALLLMWVFVGIIPG